MTAHNTITLVMPCYVMPGDEHNITPNPLGCYVMPLVMPSKKGTVYMGRK